MSADAHSEVSPFHEEDHDRSSTSWAPIGSAFGSDFPHPEGVAEPADISTVWRTDPAEDHVHDNLLELLWPC